MISLYLSEDEAKWLIAQMRVVKSAHHVSATDYNHAHMIHAKLANRSPGPRTPKPAQNPRRMRDTVRDS